MKLITDYNPSTSDIKIIKNGIAEFNDVKLNYKSGVLCILLKNEDNITCGGAFTWYDKESIYIETLWISEEFRNKSFGTKILHSVEKEAKKLGCAFCTLDTFGFQAEDFYLKNGYKRIGIIENYIRHYARIFLRKEIS